MKAVAIIPARMAASRFPGKPMANIMDMPMIGHCYHRTRLSTGMDDVYVATCDIEIAEYIHSIGGKAVMTADTHNRATDRTAEALQIIEAEIGEHIDVVVMVQGDEPLIQPQSISDTLPPFEDPDINVVNIMSVIRDYDAFVDKNNVKVVVDQRGNALYFSREAIPSPWKGWEDITAYLQVGVIAFRRDYLEIFNRMKETDLEIVESVDMNRFMENGTPIRMISSDFETIGVDTREDLVAAEKLMKTDGVISQYVDYERK
ncbi:MAG: 3-deoxy-manno-octulosonate cytidylyltransferase [Desulfobacterales bacterium]|nr:3-deoxy-manno-octulosonate cytidylyltransferase [Desulfobacterales bacterium]